MKSPRRLMVNRDGQPEHVKRGMQCSAKECCMNSDLSAMDYKDSLALKSDQFKQLVKMWDASAVSRTKNCTPSESTFGYRHSAKLVFQLDPMKKNGEKSWLKIGIYRPHSHVVVDMASCPIQTTEMNHVIGYINRNAISAGLTIYNERTHTGLLRFVTFRQTKKGLLLVTFVTNGKDDRSKLKTFARNLSAQFSNVRGVMQHINDTPGNAIFASHKLDQADERDTGTDESPHNILLTGVGELEETLNDLRFKISATSFFQVNPFVAEAMYRRIVELAELRVGQTALDLYCGVGTISLHLAKCGARVVGIDEVTSSIQDAAQNSQLNKLNATFTCGAVEVVLPDLVSKGELGKVEVVTLNPSRGGCEVSALNALLSLKPEKIVYMSCNPVSLLRDLDHLKSEYQVVVFEPFDMFPGTKHVEVLALLSKRS